MDIAAWLRDLGLERYADAFRANEVDHEILATLTTEDLSDIGVTIVGHRRKILNAAARLGDEAIAAPPDGASAERHATGIQPTKNAAERRHLTLMFVDLVGSTALSGQMDPEEMRLVMCSYQNAIVDKVSRFQGHVAKFLGDGVLAYFGFPQAHEDDAERSVRAALSIRDVLPGVQTPLGTPLEVRIGIATGLVVVGDLIGEGAAQEASVIGETPNLAARLQSLAEPGQVLISTATRQLLGDLFVLTDLGHHRLKGIGKPVRAFAVQGEQVVETRFEARHSDALSLMTGRDRELDLIKDRWHQAKTGEGQFLLLLGEAGIGKSRIVQALCEEIARDRPIRLSYQCSPYHRDSALYPVIRQLARAADLGPEDSRERKLSKLESLLGRANGRLADSAPFIAALLGIHDEDRYGMLDFSPDMQRTRTLQALIDQLIGLARQRPVLLIVEDAHWIDPTTLELIEQSIDSIVRVPVLILMTSRPDDRVDLRRRHNSTILSLNRLPRQRALSMASQLLGDTPVSPNVLDEIVEKTDGVPLFIEEVAKAVAEEGSLSAYVPATLQDSLMARLDRIPETRHIAQTAAVIGREFDLRLLRRVSLLDEPALQAVLSKLVDAGLIHCHGTPPAENYSFKHALVRDAAYESLLRKSRKELHGRIADLLTDTNEPFSSDAETLARHLAFAERHEAAIRVWTAAAEEARDHSAYKEALGLVETASRLLPHIERADSRIMLDIKLELLRAEVRQALDGPSDAAFAAYRHAQDFARQAGDHQREFMATWGLWFLNQQSMKLTEATQQARRLVPLARRSNDADHELQASHANWTTAFYKGDLIAAKKHAQMGCERYDVDRHYPGMLRFGSHDTGCCASYHVSKVSCLLGFPDTSLTYINRATRLARRIGHAGSLIISLNMEAIVRQLLGDSHGVKGVSIEFSEMAERHGMKRFAAAAPIINGWVGVVEGQGSEAIERMTRGIDALEAANALMRVSYYFGILADAQRRNGDIDSALEAVDRGLEIAVGSGEGWYLPELHHLKGTLMLQVSEVSEGVRQLQLSVDLARKTSARWFELRASTSLAKHFADQGDLQAARDLLEPVYRTFTEGTGTPDVRAAAMLIRELS